MELMTPELAFRACEMSAAGLWSGRIAELLGVEEADVRRALSGDSFEEAPPAPDEPVVEPDPTPRAPADPNAWPPPVDAATEWAEVRVARGYGLGSEAVRVRWVRLWGQRVRINAQDEVWCHYCLQFKTTAELSHPWNGCPVGLPYRGGMVSIDNLPSEADAERRWAPQYVDLMRAPW